jgi:hypothetical protein
MSSCIAYFSLWHPFDSRVKYRIMLELTGSNGIFGDISDWFFRDTTSSGFQHSEWQMHPLEN